MSRELLSTFRRDAAVAIRQLRRRPAFTVAAVATLAIGVGANTAIFSAADHVLLRPLPHHEADRVVTLWETDQESGEQAREVSPGNFVSWRDGTTSFAALGLAEPFGFDLTGLHPPEPATAWLVTEGWLEALGVQPFLGRGFLPEEFPAGPQPSRSLPTVVLLSHPFWQERYGADPGLVGGTIEVDGHPATVVGVLPPGLDYPPPREIWAPKTFLLTASGYDEMAERSAAYMLAVGRLAPGVTLDEAARDLDRVASALATDHPETNHGVGVNVVPVREQVVGDVRPALLVLLGAVALVLLIACANVASLLLARGAERQRELAVRAALGAGRGHLMRQLGTEALVLATLGGAAGVALASGGIRLFLSLAPPDLPRLGGLGLDGRTLTYATLLSLATALLFGLAPVLRFSRGTSDAALRSSRTEGAGGRQQRLRAGLVVGEIALALMLLVGAALLGRSYVTLQENALGFDVEGRAALQLFLWDHYEGAEGRAAGARDLMRRMEAVPGVREVAATTSLPFHPGRHDAQDALVREDRPGEGQQRPVVHATAATPGYFRLMGIPLLAGRGLAETDRADAPLVAVVSESLARRYFPDESPLGKRVTIGVMSRPQSREIVGVVGDVRASSLDAEPAPELFVPFDQSRNGSLIFVARSEGDPAAVLPALRAAVWETNPDQTISRSDTLADLVGATLVARRFNLSLIGALSLVGLVLATVGIYGLLTFVTLLRSEEIGVRMALGARREDVVRMILRQGVALALPGVGLGLLGAAFLTRFLASMLYGVEPVDALTFGGVAACMVLVATVATLVPARRAAATDPAVTLR